MTREQEGSQIRLVLRSIQILDRESSEFVEQLNRKEPMTYRDIREFLDRCSLMVVTAHKSISELILSGETEK